MSRFIRLVVVTLLLCTFGTLSTPAFAAAPTESQDASRLTRWEVLMQHLVAWIGVDASPRAQRPADTKDGGGDPLPDDLNKPPVPPDESSYVVDPAG